MDENKHPTQSDKEKEKVKPEQAQPGPADGVDGSPGARARQVLSKRWLYPAIYLGAAALIIGLMYVRTQMGAHRAAAPAPQGGETQPVTAPVAETYAWPVAPGVQPKVTLGFFPSHGSDQAKAQAMVSFDNAFYPHLGIDIKSADGQPFGVAAAIAGKVTKVTDTPLYGKTVEISSADGNVEQYASLSDVSVKVGDEVQQGEIIGTSGTCAFEQSQGDHLYFEVMQAGQPVDPTTLLPKM
ncbi:MAG: M23 family metallopeptidase [Alicyclobacillaceae bacterium]|nr:M23 family metallopeptidase [Alicyclobacillaceae bacterium]